MIDKFEKCLKEAGRSKSWFWRNYISMYLGTGYSTFLNQINGVAKLKIDTESLMNNFIMECEGTLSEVFKEAE